MIDYLGYNLTEYKAFRSLQLQYIKTLTLNQNLQEQVNTLTEAYDKKCSEVSQLKSDEMNQRIKLQNQNLKYKKLYKNLFQQVQKTISAFKGIKVSPKNTKQSPENQHDNSKNNLSPFLNPNKSHISEEHSMNDSSMSPSHNQKSLFIHLEESQTFEKLTTKLRQMVTQHQTLRQKNTSLTKRIETFESLYKNETMEKEKTQMMIIKQVQNLQGQLEELNQVNIELEAKINIKDKQRRKLDVQLRHFKQENVQLSQRINEILRQKEEKSEEDPEFAIDFMTFQLHSIQSMFTRIAQQTKCSNDISNLISILYSDYEEISQIFREKLQIEYDLQELQQRYKSQKSSSTADQALLIETRRQIQAFRLELLKQKQVFRQKEQYIEEHFQEYNKVNEQELKIKNYSYELQSRLYKQKRSGIETSEKFVTTRNPTAREILLRRTTGDVEKPSESNTTNTKGLFSGTNDFNKHETEEQTVDKEESSSMPSKKTSLRFKQSHNAEEIMNEIIKKDKANMQKILKDTRKSPIPIYLGK